jgi:hypothetical protein
VGSHEYFFYCLLSESKDPPELSPYRRMDDLPCRTEWQAIVDLVRGCSVSKCIKSAVLENGEKISDHQCVFSLYDIIILSLMGSHAFLHGLAFVSYRIPEYFQSALKDHLDRVVSTRGLQLAGDGPSHTWFPLRFGTKAWMQEEIPSDQSAI